MPRIKFKKTATTIATVSVIFVIFHALNEYWTGRDFQILLVTSKIKDALGTGNGRELVLPQVRTTLVEPRTLNNCEEDGKNVLALMMIISSPENFKNRQILRQTLGRRIRDYNFNLSGIPVKPHEKLQFFFFTGLSKNDSVNQLVRKESDRFGYMVVDNMTESYFKLTIKTLRMLKWTRDNCRLAKYLVKMDDDVHLNLAKFTTYLKDVPQNLSNQLVAGHKYRNQVRNRDPSSKWYVPRSFWPDEEPEYPDYVGGFFYILGRRAANEVYEASLETSLFPLEDVFLTGFVARSKLNLEITNIEWAEHWWSPFYALITSTCSFQNYMVVHNIRHSDMLCWTVFSLMEYRCGVMPVFVYCMLS